MGERSGVSFAQLVDRVVDEGIAAATRDYHRPEDKQKLDGSVAGFQRCRGLDPTQLREALLDARLQATEAHRSEAGDYWWWRCRELEVEWVCNVVSAALMNVGLPVIVQPTVRGFMLCAEIVGVSG